MYTYFNEEFNVKVVTGFSETLSSTGEIQVKVGVSFTETLPIQVGESLNLKSIYNVD